MPRVPDEILSDILTPALKISDEVFSDTAYISPFADYSVSTSAYLLVCKDWLRVATPLLYNVVVLRSKSQANALEDVFSKQKSFGRYVKKLRVEGGYGLAMHKILKSTPNLTDLFLTLGIYASDSVRGLCTGLPLINPRRVILSDSNTNKPMTNDNRLALRDVLMSCLSKWGEMKTFHFPYSASCYEGNRWSAEGSALSQALVKSPALETLVTPSFRRIPHYFDTLLKSQSLRVIEVRGRPNPQVAIEPRFKRLLKYTDEVDAESTMRRFLRLPNVDATKQPETNLYQPGPEIAPSIDPSYTPLCSVSGETREKIWKRVMFFAMYVEELRQFPRPQHPSRLPVLLVSKMFNEFALPLFLRFTGFNPHTSRFVVTDPKRTS
ncbi:F-box domain-containing protein [Mycena venus]|uniref:F-box domain-containing protein n=1 Tax=Mycena venus TaxID=2733690 RepID=A0A8H7D7W7_9AGAR|nr:F-box domain-containing protein [Mycena venus]